MPVFRYVVLVVNLVVGGMLSLLLLLAQEVSNELDCVTGQDEGGGDRSLARQNEARTIIAASLLVLAGVDVQDVVLALESLVVGEQHETLGVRVQLTSGFLDHGPPLIDLGQCLVAKVVGFLDVRLDVLVGAGQVRQDGTGESFIGRTAQLEGLLAVRVRLESLDAVVNKRVVVQVLCTLCVSLNKNRTVEAVCQTTGAMSRLRNRTDLCGILKSSCRYAQEEQDWQPFVYTPFL